MARTQICPLACQLTVTGKLIAEFGEGWESSIPALIAAQHGNELRQRALSTVEQASADFTLEDRIFKVSLNALHGKYAAETRRLFRYFALFMEGG